MRPDIIRGNVQKNVHFPSNLHVFENHRWPVYHTERHALYSQTYVNACTIFVVHPDSINR